MLRSSIILILASIPLFGNLAHGAFNRPYTHCESVVDQQLDRLNVDRADIEKLFYTNQVRSSSRGENTNVVGFDTWVRFKSCKGYLVIDMTRHCHVRQVYTRGQCRIPGVKSF